MEVLEVPYSRIVRQKKFEEQLRLAVFTALDPTEYWGMIMHQSIPPAPPPPPPPRADPRALPFFLPWMANSWGWELFSCQILRGRDEKRGQMPRPPSTGTATFFIARTVK